MKACALRSKPWIMALTAGAALSVLFLPGCGVSTASPNAPRVTGRVTYRGKPVTKGTVVLTSSERSKAYWGAGIIRQDGTFAIDPYPPEVFLERGRYNIALVAPQPSRAKRIVKISEEASLDPSKQNAEADPKFEIPDRFLDAKTSGLWVNLERDSNWVDIELNDQGQ